LVFNRFIFPDDAEIIVQQFTIPAVPEPRFNNGDTQHHRSRDLVFFLKGIDKRPEFLNKGFCLGKPAMGPGKAKSTAFGRISG
jgi:hypothetical protein